MPLPKRLSLFKPTPVLLAVVLAALLVIWMLSGDTRSAQDEPPAAQVTPEQGLHQVETRWLEASPQVTEKVAQGQLLPWQQVSVRAQVAGSVEQLLRQQGDSVTAGTTLLTLSNEGRREQLAQARATLNQRESELSSARSLTESRFIAETELARLESEAARARAELVSAELALQYAEPVAPFDGIVNRRHVEVGDWVQPGADLMELVDVGQLKVTAQISQQDVGLVAAGQAVDIRLLDGRRLEGVVNFVSHAADPSTRSFYIEVSADNPELWRVAGASATLRIQLEPVVAHRVSPALLSLNEDGQLGVRTVDAQSRVVFQTVRVLSIDNQGATIAGLPDRVQVITLGAGFVRPGQQVVTRGAVE